jgi:peptidoglycan/LPS O-acetylase OafA/YrhL
MRGIAVLIVVIFHAFPNFLAGGFVGVDIFFVISGFLISKILITSLEQNAFSYADFYARRVKRIFPALVIVLAASLAFGWFALFPDEFKLLGKHIIGGVGFVSNIMLWFEVGYFDTAAETKPLLHLWSLGIEEQFYIFWPILLAIAFKFRTKVLGMTLVLLAVSLLVNVAGVHRLPSATFYSIASRAWELLIGAALACLSMQKISIYFGGVRRRVEGGGVDTVPLFDSASPAGRSLMSFVGFGFIILACVLVRGGKSFPGWWALLPTLGAALLIAAGPTAWVNRVILSSRLFVWIGLISYPLYLWHWPLLSFAQIVESGTPAVAIRVSAVVAAVVFAWLTYKLLETPIRRQGKSSPATVAVLSILMVAVAGVGGWIFKNEGLPLRASIVQNANLQKALITVEDRDNAAACKARYGFDTLWEYCLLARVDQAPTVALIGDSHAYHVVAGLSKYYGERGENLLYLGTRIPFFGVKPGVNDRYQEATPQMLDLALATPSIKTVVISTILKLNNDTEEGKLLVEQFRTTLRKYVDAGKQVIYFYDVPTLDFDPRACIKRAGIASSTTNRDCSMAAAEYRKTVEAHNEIVASVLKEFPIITTFAPATYLCNEARCQGMIDKKLMYRDTNHLTYDGDLYIGLKFAEEQKTKALVQR